MKKVLVLVLVLGMATLANAGILSITQVSDGAAAVTVDRGVAVQLQLSYTGDFDVVSFISTVDPAGMVLSDAAMPSLGDLNADLGGVPIAQAGGIMQFDATNSNGLALTQGVWGTFTVVSDTAGTFNVAPAISALLDTAWGNGAADVELQGATITVTPEPATMLILGLGGLLLRRK